MDTNERYLKLQSELMALADRVQREYSDNKHYHDELKYTIEHLQRIHNEIAEAQRNNMTIVSSVDKEQAIQGEKNSNIFYQLEKLEERLEELERNSDKKDDNTRQFVEKIIMLVIGGLVTWLFSALQAK